MKKSILVSSVALSAVFLFGALSFADHHEKSDNTIKDVMKKAHMPFGKALANKVANGKATDDDKLALLDLYVTLVEATPPKGDAASWQALSGRAALAAAKVAVGREGAEAELKQAMNCKACHDAHKPPAEQ